MSQQKISGEIQAMAAVEGVLESLDEGARRRVLRWAAEKYNVALQPSTDPRRAGAGSGEASGSGVAGGAGAGAKSTTSLAEQQFETFADLYAAASPTTDADRVLVAAYWATVVQAQTELDARSLNNQLRDLGYPVNHMPSAFDNLIARTPKPVVQTKKTGKTKQATRRIKLTAEGRRAVERMIADGQPV